ncbi:hypothetical protein C8A00DRAFT_30959 [Chaetomidium leptoderma]|uniref:2EXR domain-containing protein n=1 Tax=Chaetomidium leptoderma TaxID=669021 RepID=A0AAN6VRY1_9PEZI|nr:hypothetical protein C8A00DRAFT_30959 [Chaetomidium leptoderma]
MATTADAGSFTLFAELPVEIQLVIWEAAVPEPSPEVCLVWPRFLVGYHHSPPTQPFVVDTAWPATTHVCRASREVAFKSGHVRLRYSKVAGLRVPFRMFDPAIDTLFELQLVSDTESLRVIEVICGAVLNLRTVSIVLSNSATYQPATLTFLTPRRRFLLRAIPPTVHHGIILIDPPVPPRKVHNTVHLRQYMHYFRVNLETYGRQRHLVDDGAAAGDTGEPSLGVPEIKIQTFVEYVKTRDDGPQWVEVCGSRLNCPPGHQGARGHPPWLAEEDRMDPEICRGLDQDSKWGDSFGG